jgi:SprT protein
MQLEFFRKLTSALQGLTHAPVPVPPPPAQPPEDLLEKSRALLRQIGCDDLAATVQVRWNPRMRSTAGLAYPEKSLIVLNPKLVQFGAAELDRTLRHELAHLLAHHRAGRRRINAHGPEWKRACRDLGLADEKRCHDLPLPRRSLTRRHKYRCPGCETVIDRVRPIRRKSACLSCCRAHSGGRYDERFRLKKVVP